MGKATGRMATLLAVAAPLLFSQQGSVAGPVSGYVFDRMAHVLLPVQGIAGAAVLGSPVNFGMTVALVTVSPRLDSAIVVGADRSLHLFKMNGGAVSEVPANGLGGLTEGVVFSPAGSAAAIYAAGRVQVISGLPGAPVAGAVLDARANQDASALTVRPHPYRLMATEAFAVSDDGTLVLVASDGGVRVMQAAGGEQTLMAAVSGASIAFAPGSHDAAVAVPNGAGLLVIRDVAVAGTQQPIAPASDIATANGVAFSADGAKLYVAKSSGGVSVYDVASKNRTDVSCDCVAFGLTPMGGLFRLNELGTGPLWLLDPAGSRIVFVPAKTN